MNRRDLTQLKKGDYVECVRVFKASKNNLTEGRIYKIKDVWKDYGKFQFEIIGDRGDTRAYSSSSSQFRIHLLHDDPLKVEETGQRVELVWDYADINKLFTIMPVPLPIEGDYVELADFVEEDLTMFNFRVPSGLIWSVNNRTWCKNEHGVYLRLFLTAE